MLSFAAYLGSHLVGSNRKLVGDQSDTTEIVVQVDFLENTGIKVDFTFDGDVKEYPHLVKTLDEAKSVTGITNFLIANHYDYYSGHVVKNHLKSSHQQ